MSPSDNTMPSASGAIRGGVIDPASPSYKWWVAFTVTLSTFLISVSQGSVQVALPSIMTAFGLNIDQAQWIVIGQVIAGAIMVPMVGWLGNRLGNRTLYLLSMLTFLAGSTLCAFAWSSSSLIAFRVISYVQGAPNYLGRILSDHESMRSGLLLLNDEPRFLTIICCGLTVADTDFPL